MTTKLTGAKYNQDSNTNRNFVFEVYMYIKAYFNEASNFGVCDSQFNCPPLLSRYFW